MELYSHQHQIALEFFITPKGNSEPIKIILHIVPLRRWLPPLSVYIFMILIILDSLLSRIAQNLYIDFCLSYFIQDKVSKIYLVNKLQV